MPVNSPQMKQKRPPHPKDGELNSIYYSNFGTICSVEEGGEGASFVSAHLRFLWKLLLCRKQIDRIGLGGD